MWGKYIARWAEKVLSEAGKRNMRALSFYSGHSTYSTTGLAHPDPQLRKNLLKNWLRLYAHAASVFGGVGFYQHAFTDDLLQSPEKYDNAYNELDSVLSDAAGIIHDSGCPFAAVEQMYTPRQITWTIEGKLFQTTA